MQKQKILLAATRISLGFIFLWAFLDKVFGLGFATTPDKSWLTGTSPTSGFLEFGTQGTFAEIFQSMAGSPVVDWLFMLGLLLLGVALILGVGMRLAAYGGSLLMVLMWFAVFPSANNPLIDEHVIYALVLWLLMLNNAGEHYGLGKRWQQTKLVKKYSILK